MLLTDSICFLYAIYIRYIDPNFVNKYPKIHLIIETVSNIYYIITLFISIYSTLKFIHNFLKSIYSVLMNP